MPLLCSLGFHKWRNYGNEIEISWQEPPPFTGKNYATTRENLYTRPDVFSDSAGLGKRPLDVHSRVMFEGQKCERCGIKLRRKLIRNEDGTLSSIGWEPDTEHNTNET